MSEDVNIPIVGDAGEPCGSCGAPLAADQRYCLQCGTRRGAARVDFERHLAAASAAGGAQPAAAESAPATAAAPAPQPKVLTPLVIVGSIATLGVMLVLGVLIGKDNTTNTTATPVASNPPKVVVQSGPGGASTAKTGKSPATNEKAAKKTGKTATKGAAKPADTGPIDTGDAATVGDDALGALDTGDTDANAKASAELPDTVATEGKPDKPDNKPPGAGTAATVIK